ncbi:hypothetical protein DDN11_19700 [Vibrio cholerae]|nr:hypothetical protein [Vibrio cholerae]EGR3967823.1 hypothetical protein [Vibrio cholerae]
MKTIKLIGLLTLIASPFVSANTAMTFPGENGSVPDVALNLPTSKTPVTFYDGFKVENGVFRSQVNGCTVDLSNPEYEAKLIWEGVSPKVIILSNTNLISCRAHQPSDMEIDLTHFLNNIPMHIRAQMVLANHVSMLLKTQP